MEEAAKENANREREEKKKRDEHEKRQKNAARRSEMEEKLQRAKNRVKMMRGRDNNINRSWRSNSLIN